VHWLRRLVDDLSPQRRRFSLRPADEAFLVDSRAMEHISLRVFCIPIFSSVTKIPHSSVSIADGIRIIVAVHRIDK
jgi:hypothetical protein